MYGLFFLFFRFLNTEFLYVGYAEVSKKNQNIKNVSSLSSFICNKIKITSDQKRIFKWNILVIDDHAPLKFFQLVNIYLKYHSKGDEEKHTNFERFKGT